jgi:spermidine synthase
MAMNGGPGASKAAARERFSPILLLLFAGSGCAALIYELIWFQLLREVIGSSAVSLALVLTSFMAGMCAGSLALPRWVSPTQHPLRVYAWLELGIGALGIALLGLLPLAGRLYLAIVGYGHAGIALRAVLCLICLLPPTLLMGATLPALSRWLQTTRSGVSRLGLLYMANIAGGVAGCLLAGFYLLRVYDLVVTSLCAAALNVLVALVALRLAGGARFTAPQTARLARPSFARHRAAYVAVALSGLTALGAEVVWTRLLSLIFGGTVFTFTIILAIFLAGLGIGSAVGALVARHVARPCSAFAWCQLALVAAIPLAAHVMNAELPYWIVNPDFHADILHRYFHDLLRGAVAMLPATCLWGASFPLALAAAAEDDQDPGYLVGGVYAANTVGAILGALLFSLVLIPAVGTRAAQQSLTLLSGLAALLMFGAALFSGWTGESEAAKTPTPSDVWVRSQRAAAGVLILAFTILMIRLLPPTSRDVIAIGRDVADTLEWREERTFHFVGEGASASVAVTEHAGKIRSFHVGGKVVASNDPRDLRLGRMLGHMPALFHPKPRSVLVVGFGAGITAGSFVLYPEIERIVICEIEPIVFDGARAHFAAENHGVLDDPRVEVIRDDARHFIASTREKFDIVTSDPIHPWMDGLGALYTAEYHELVKRRLNPGGFAVQWAPLYETDEASAKSQIGTFLHTFPEGTLWSSVTPGAGYDIVLLGQIDPLHVDTEALDARLRENPRLEASLAEVYLSSAIELLATYAGRGRELEGWLKDAQINRDLNMRLQYLAGLSFDLSQEQEIYETLAGYRSYPEDMIGAPGWVHYRLKRLLRGELETY